MGAMVEPDMDMKTITGKSTESSITTKSTDNIDIEVEIVKIRKRDIFKKSFVLEVKFLDYGSKNVPTTNRVVIANYHNAIYEGDIFTGTGKWIRNKRFGYTFITDTFEKKKPTTLQEIAKFLINGVLGLGNVAYDIVDTFQYETFDIAKEDYKRLTSIKGVSEELALEIKNTIEREDIYGELMSFLMNKLGKHRLTSKVHQQFGSASMALISDNPYILSKINGFTFKDLDILAKDKGLAFNDNRRVIAGIEEALNNQIYNEGDLYVEKGELGELLIQVLLNTGVYLSEDIDGCSISYEQVNELLQKLENDEKIKVVSNDNEEECIYLTPVYHTENNIVRSVKEIFESKKPPLILKEDIDTYILDYQKKSKMILAERQREAIKSCITEPMSILTGGPGTGKSQTISVIIDCIKTLHPYASIRLCAPTGKASRRMTELSGMEATTVHKALQIGVFDEESEVELDEDYLILDETSMLDIFVFSKLLKSIGEDTRIIFVGDVQQLPSVGSGAVFRDLINSNVIKTIELNEIFRQSADSKIIQNAYKLLNQKKTTDKGSYIFSKKGDEEGDFFFTETKDVMKCQSLVIQSVKKLTKELGYNLKDIQILTPLKKGAIGVKELNFKMQNNFNPPAEDKKELEVGDMNILRVNDRVVQTKNNSDLGVFNGDVGHICDIRVDIIDNIEVDIVEVDFDGKIVECSLEDLHDLELAYAMTIHKSQGSEFPCVIIPMDLNQKILLNKNLVYTGWTRAKEIVVCLGDKEALNYASEREDGVNRNSNLAEKLQKLSILS